MRKKILASILAISVLSFGSIEAAPNDACPALAKLSSSPVKHIGEDYIDSNGYRVMPCGRDKFFIVEKLEDGEKRYNESNSPLLNTDVYADVIKVNIGTNTTITYGKTHIEIEDIYDFQKELQKKKLEAPDSTEAPSDFYLYCLPYLNKIPDELPEEFINLTPEAKQELIKKYYKEFNTKLGAFHTYEKKLAFIENAVKDNRLIHPTQKVINQYTIDAELADGINEEGKPLLPKLPSHTTKGEIEGYLYSQYLMAKNDTEIIDAIPDVILNIISDTDVTVDKKLSIMYNLSQEPKKIVEVAKQYSSLQEESLTNKPLNKQTDEGTNEYNALSQEEKVAYNTLLLEINEKIIEAEYNNLPETVTRKQYKALSDIDKYKYAPTRTKGFVDRSIYKKNPLDLCLKYKI